MKRHVLSSPRSLVQLSLGLSGAFFLAACAGDTTTTSATSAALDTAQCTFQANRATADACFATFQACVTAANADLAACRTALQACLPPPPPGRGPGPDADGGRPPRPPPPGADGGLPPPPPGGPGAGPGGVCPGDADGGMGGPHGRGPGGPGGHQGGPRPEPDSAAVQACHDALNTCLAATPGDVACFETERTCIHDAFAAAFAAVCATASSCDAATDPACAHLQQRCTEGVDGRPGAFDGGTCP